ncbi:MAG: protoporphyrinogen oxidase [Actinomycetota bacterium]
MSGVAVIGGGVSGLTTAYRLQAAGIEATVLEAAATTGGKLRSVDVGGLRLPAGPDSFLARKPWAVELCRELGIGGELVSPRASGAFLWTATGLVPYPTGTAFGIPGDLGDAFRWPGLSRSGRRRALLDLLKPKRRADADESLGSLLRRRLGDEATDLAIGPLLGGLYAGDVDQLSVRATFPELQKWEAAQGSLLRGAQVASRNGRRSVGGPMFLRPRAGVERLTELLAEQAGDRVHTDTRATAIEATASGWQILTDDGSIEADAVVITVDAPAAAALLSRDAVAPLLAHIPFVSTGAVLFVYPEGTATDLPDGSGFVVPRGAAPMTACTWLSAKWPDPAYGGRAVLRCFVGAAGEEDIVDAPDEDLIAACARHLAALLPLPERPEHAAVVRWPAAMPQYLVGHLDHVAEIRASLPAGIFVTGQSLDGVGISDCVRAAGTAAEQVATYLAQEART